MNLRQSRDALAEVKSLALQRIPIGITSTYKCMMFEEKIHPLRIGPDHITYRAPKMQISMTLSDTVYLYSPVLPETVRANQRTNRSTGELELTNFSYIGSSWRPRQEQRVQPEHLIPVQITIQQTNYRATLTNLSLHGSNVLLYLPGPNTPMIAPRMPVDFSFQLNEQTHLSMRGNIISLQAVGQSLLRVGLKLLPNPAQEAWMEDYITRRKVEIISELEQQMMDLVEAQPRSDLHF